MIDKIKTWHIEAAVIFVALAATVLVSGNHWKEWIGAGAVMLSFLHAQIADRLAEAQKKLIVPNISCYPLANRYLTSKEVLWITYFIVSGAWSAMTGAVLFALYPFWRKYYRTKIKLV